MIYKSTVEISSLRKYNSTLGYCRVEKSFLFMLLLLPLAGCLMNNGEQEISLRRSQQQRNYLMFHHDESISQNNQNHRRIAVTKKSSISRDNRNRGGKRLQKHAFNSADSIKRLKTSSKNSGSVYSPKKNRSSFKGREIHRQKSMFEIPECDPNTGCVNVTKTFATLGRTASMNCFAENLVGQKTVSWVRHRDVSLIAVGKFVYISDKRFRVLHESNSNDWILTIKSVTYKDQGIYECQITSDPEKSFKYILRVVEPRTEIVGKKELYVDYASSLNITCLIKSPNPPAYVFWKKEGKVVDMTGSPSNYTHKVLGSRKDRWSNNNNIVSSQKPNQLSRKANKRQFDASDDITSLATRSPSIFHTSSTERPYMSNISYVVIPTKGSVRVLYKKHWKPGVTVSSLLIDRVNYTHSGIFWCMPSNSANKSVHVHVLKDDSKPAAIHTTHQESASNSPPLYSIRQNTFKNMLYSMVTIILSIKCLFNHHKLV